MTTKNSYISLVFTMLCSYLPLTSLGQVSEGGKPHSFTTAFSNEMTKKNSLTSKVLPSLDVSDLEVENANNGGLHYYAKAYPVNFNLNNSGQWVTLNNGDRLWRLQLHVKGAKSLEALYDDFYLPERAKFFVYNKTGDHMLGAFTKSNNREHGKFATSIVPGDVITFEYYEPQEALGQGRIHINRLDYGFDNTNLPNKNFGSSDDCHTNINCPQGDDWQDEKRGIARISVRVASGTGWCSGSLLNNTATDSRALFLTAWHCAESDYSLLNQWIFYFNFESANCSNPPESPDLQSVTGASLLTDSENGDMLLLELNSAVPDSYVAYYNGWNRGNSPNSNTVTGVHHPAGDIKKISVADNGYYSNSSSVTFGGGSVPFVIPAGNLWGCIWTEGTTEPGSSGSPLFDSNGYVLGQLTGGSSSCSNLTGANWYGKISASWSLLQPYLDPLETAPITLNGLDPRFNFDNNVGVIKIEVETSPCEYTSTTPVEITIRNMGDNSQTNIQYRYVLEDRNGTELLNQTATYTGTVASLQSVVLTINLDLSALGDYNIYAETNLPGDENTEDDASELDVSNIKATEATSNLQITPNNTSSFNLSLTRGNGENVIILVKEGSAFTTDDLPIDGVSYSASSTYGVGSFIGDAIVVYKGSGTSVTISNLSIGVNYYIAAVEYSCFPEFYLDNYTETTHTITNLESEVSDKTIKVYPNPAQDNINISYEGLNTKSLQVDIYNNLGYKINSLTLKDTKQIDINYLNSGIYILKIYNKTGFTYRKLVVE